MLKISVFVIIAVAAGVTIWLNHQSTPATTEQTTTTFDRSVTPKHMQGHHAEEIALYWDRRAALGNPADEPAASAVRKIIAYQLNLDHYLRINPEDLKATDKLSDFGLDQLAVVEMTFDVEQSYDGRLQLPDYPDHRLLSIRVVDLVKAAEQIE